MEIITDETVNDVVFVDDGYVAIRLRVDLTEHPQRVEIGHKTAELAERLFDGDPIANTGYRDELLKSALNALAYAIVTHGDRELSPEPEPQVPEFLRELMERAIGYR